MTERRLSLRWTRSRKEPFDSFVATAALAKAALLVTEGQC